LAELLMTYSVKEIFYTLQGEGANAGRAAVFCRFAGCNLWSGREEDRANAICRFCDTDFVGTDGTDGGKFETPAELAQAIARAWQDGAGGVGGVRGERQGRPLTVLTGGEPLLQVDAALIDALHEAGIEIAVETNGTIAAPSGIDWVCVSPKAGAALKQTTGNEIKVVVPQLGLDMRALAGLDFAHRFVQPMDGPLVRDNTAWAIDWCMKNPAWRLSVQTHKVIGIR
jgi:7-carboxy-7-deazaguanine synthase